MTVSRETTSARPTLWPGTGGSLSSDELKTVRRRLAKYLAPRPEFELHRLRQKLAEIHGLTLLESGCLKAIGQLALKPT